MHYFSTYELLKLIFVFTKISCLISLQCHVHTVKSSNLENVSPLNVDDGLSEPQRTEQGTL